MSVSILLEGHSVSPCLTTLQLSFDELKQHLEMWTGDPVTATGKMDSCCLNIRVSAPWLRACVADAVLCSYTSLTHPFGLQPALQRSAHGFIDVALSSPLSVREKAAFIKCVGSCDEGILFLHLNEYVCSSNDDWMIEWCHLCVKRLESREFYL